MINIEPLMFFYTFSYMFISIIEYDFFLKKACLTHLNYNNTICKNITYYPTEQQNVQIIVSTFIQYKNLIDKILPIFMAYFLANKFKTYRTFGLIFGFIGKIFYGITILLNNHYFYLNLQFCYLSILPLIITGGDIIITSSIYSIITDTTEKKNLSFKISIVQACYFISMPIGTYLGKFMFYDYLKNNEKNFHYMFLIYILILIFCLYYSLLLYYKSNNEEYIIIKTNTSFKKNIKYILNSFNIYKGFKDIKLVSIKLLFVATMLYSFQKDEKSYIYLYTKKNFKWDGNNFSFFKIIQYILMTITMVIGLPLINKFTNINEYKIIFASTISGVLGKLIYYFSYESYYLFIGLIIGCLNPCSSCMIKTLISKLVNENNSGKIFVILNIFDILVMSFSNIIYGTIYNITIKNRFSGIFLLSAFSQFLLFILIFFINKKK